MDYPRVSYSAYMKLNNVSISIHVSYEKSKKQCDDVEYKILFLPNFIDNRITFANTVEGGVEVYRIFSSFQNF